MALDFPVGTDFPANGNQIPDGEIYEGFYWDEATGVWKRLCERDKIGDCLDDDAGETVCDKLDFIQREIVELEEEIDAIATSQDRGTWDWAFTVNNYLDPLPAGKFYMVDGNNGLAIATEYVNATKIIFSKTDAEGDNHSFTADLVDKVLMLFDRPDDDFLESIITAVDEPNGANYAIIDVTHIQSLGGPTNEADAEGRYKARLNIFDQPTGGNAGEYVLKQGDDMTGRLSMEQTAELENFLIPQAKTQPNIRFKATKPGSTTSTFVSLYQPGYKTALACSAAFYATTLITKNYLYGCVDDFASDGRIIRDIKNASISFLRPDDNDTDKDIGSLNFSSDSKLTWGKDRIEILKPVGHNVNATGFKIRGTRPLLPGGSDVFDNNGDIFRVKHVNNEADFIEYLGQIKDSACLVNKGYVDDAISNATKSALVDVRTNNPSNPDIGHMWYNKSTNQLLLRIS